MPDYPTFIPDAGACLVTHNVLRGVGRVKWMLRVESRNEVDNGWRIFSHVDDDAYLADPDNFQVTDFNAVCAIQPALIGIYDFPVGSDLQIVDEGDGITIVDTASGREVPPENFYVPPQHRA